MNKLENYQKSMIQELQTKLQYEKNNHPNGANLTVLEKQLAEAQENLEKTVKEKETLEVYLLQMEDSLENAKETEAALERARKEIETLEMYFPEFADSDNDDNETPEEQGEAYKPLPSLTIDEKADPELFGVVSDNRLYGILNEFWMSLDMPPLQVVSERNISRPKDLNFWSKTNLGKEAYWVLIGTNQSMCESLTKAIFNKNSALSDDNFNKSTGKLGKVLAETLANELNPDFAVGTAEYLTEQNMQQALDKAAIAAELLVRANNQPLYICLVKPTN